MTKYRTVVVQERVEGKRDAVTQLFRSLHLLSASCRCALLAGLLALQACCRSFVVSCFGSSIFKIHSGLRDQSFMIFMLNCVSVVVAVRFLCIFLVFPRGFVVVLCLSSYLP